MPEDKDTNAEGVARDAAATGGNTGSNDAAPLPIFVSYIYDFVKTGLGGDPGGRPGTIGGPIAEQDPKFKVLTYQYMPPQVQMIDNS